MADKIYCGSGKARDTQYGVEYNLLVDLSTLEAEFAEHGFRSGQDGKMIRLKLKERKEPSEKGMTHYLIVDTWKPDAQAQTVKKVMTDKFSDDIPF